MLRGMERSLLPVQHNEGRASNGSSKGNASHHHNTMPQPHYDLLVKLLLIGDSGVGKVKRVCNQIQRWTLNLASHYSRVSYCGSRKTTSRTAT